MSFNASESGHVVNILPPQDIDGGANSDVFSMKRYAHASIIIAAGSMAAASTVTVEECDDFVPTNSTAIAFSYYKEETSGGDTLSTKQSATAAGFAMTTNNNTMYTIELDAAQLSDGYPCVRVVFSDPSGSDTVSAVAVLSGGRYQPGGTAIA